MGGPIYDFGGPIYDPGRYRRTRLVRRKIHIEMTIQLWVKIEMYLYSI